MPSESPHRSLLVFSVLSLLYLLSQFYRVSSAVIAPSLIRDLNLSAESLGLLGGAFFYAFALLQIPIGPMLDRIGPRKVLFGFVFAGGIGSLLFALGETLTAVMTGRILIGIGMASVLMGSMKVFILRFSPERFATLSGLIFSVGSIGNIIASSPLAFLASTIGWRRVFLLAGGVTLLLSFIIYGVLREARKERSSSSPSPSGEPAMGILQSMKTIVKSPAFWQIGFMGFFRYGSLVSLQGLWLGPFLMDIKGLSPVEAGHLLIFLAIGLIVGAPVSGRLSDHVFHSRKDVALAGVSLYALTLLPLIGASDSLNPAILGVLFFFMGFFSGFGLLIFSHAKEVFPIAISGTVITFINFFIMLGGAMFMAFLGKVIGSFPRQGQAYPPEAYRLAFLLCFLGLTASLIFYAFSKRR